MSDGNHILRPIPRRAPVHSPILSESSSPIDASTEAQPSGIQTPGKFTAPRTKSILNLTASTLFGIYADDADSPRDSGRDDYNSLVGATPFDTNGASTPVHPPSPHKPFPADSRLGRQTLPVIGTYEKSMRGGPSRRLARRSALQRAWQTFSRTVVLFTSGMAYGVLVTHLHDDRNIAPIPVEALDRWSGAYLGFWGVCGVVLGTILPQIDKIWQEDDLECSQTVTLCTTEANVLRVEEDNAAELGASWHPVVRSIGVFVAMGFAMRRLPWESTLQASLSLGLVNPFLWYLTDRTTSGFVVSTMVGIFGTATLIGTDIVPSPATYSQASQSGNATSFESAMPGVSDHESTGLWVWIASVLFCSSLCFGNIGRRLAYRA